jgi:ABC-2 type transport system permease protein
LTALPVPPTAFREQGVPRRMSTTPVRPSRMLAAQLIVNLVLALVSLGLFLGVGRAAFGTPLPAQAAGFALAFGYAAVRLFTWE